MLNHDCDCIRLHLKLGRATGSQVRFSHLERVCLCHVILVSQTLSTLITTENWAVLSELFILIAPYCTLIALRSRHFTFLKCPCTLCHPKTSFWLTNSKAHSATDVIDMWTLDNGRFTGLDECCLTEMSGLLITGCQKSPFVQSNETLHVLFHLVI